MQGAGSVAKTQYQAITICWRCCITTTWYSRSIWANIQDNSLNFGKHITKISEKAGKELDVLCRLKNILSFRTKLCLYNSFIMSHFHYSSPICHHCLKSDSKNLDRLHEPALRYLYNDESSQTSTAFWSYWLQPLIIVFKTINNYPPEHLRDLFRLRDNIKNLRGLNKLQVPKPNTTRYGENSVKYLAAITLEQDFWYRKILNYIVSF